MLEPCQIEYRLFQNKHRDFRRRSFAGTGALAAIVAGRAKGSRKSANGGQAMERVSKLAGALAGLAFAAIMSAAPALAEDVTLNVFYSQPSFAKYHEPIAQAFMKQHPDIKINFRAPAANYDEGHQAMLRQVVTNQLPDIYFPGFHLLSELTKVLLKRQQIMELTPLLAAEPEDWRKKNYADKIIDLGKVDGKLYGLAVNASLPIMYYNTELVKKAGGDPQHMPDTWDGVIALAAKIKALGPNIAGMPIMSTTGRMTGYSARSSIRKAAICSTLPAPRSYSIPTLARRPWPISAAS
jgi:ABC-type glycerol-3-phosphate transport system substrate-binding protein